MKNLPKLLVLTSLLSSTLAPVSYATQADTCVDRECGSQTPRQGTAPAIHSEEDYANTVAVTTAAATAVIYYMGGAALYYMKVPALLVAAKTAAIWVVLPVGVLATAVLLGKTGYDAYTTDGGFLVNLQTNAEQASSLAAAYVSQGKEMVTPYGQAVADYASPYKDQAGLYAQSCVDYAAPYMTPGLDVIMDYAHATLPASLMDGSGLTVENFKNHPIEVVLASLGTGGLLYGAGKIIPWMQDQGERTSQKKMAQKLEGPLQEVIKALEQGNANFKTVRDLGKVLERNGMVRERTGFVGAVATIEDIVMGINRGGVRGVTSPVVHMGIGVLVFKYGPAALKGAYDYSVYMAKKAVAKAHDYLNQAK